MKFRPLQDRILVKRITPAEKTDSGLFIPDNGKEKPVEAVVIAVGNGVVLKNGELRKPEVKPGDRIMLAKYGGTEVTIDAQEHLVLKEDELLCVLT